MVMRKLTKQRGAVPFADRHSRLFPERPNPLDLRSRFRVEVAPGTDAPEAMSVRSRALTAWMLECWREDRKAEPIGEGIPQSRKHPFQTSRPDLN